MITTPHDPADPWARALRTAMSPARALEPTEAEVARALATAPARRATPPRLVPRLAVALLVALVLVGGLSAVPATRAAVSGVYGTLSGWVSGDEDTAPGRPIPAGDRTPGWVAAARGEKRLIAGRHGANLYVVRDGQTVEVAIGPGIGMGTTMADWRKRFADDRIVPLGTTAFPDPAGGTDDRPLDAHDRRPFMGLTSKDVERVELAYTTGRPTVQRHLDGGFVLLADARRRPTRLTAYAADGRALEARDASNLDLRVCRDERGCPPGAWDPPVVYDPPLRSGAPFLPKVR